VSADELAVRVKKLVDSYAPEKYFVVSGISGNGCQNVCFAVMDHIEALRRHERASAPTAASVDAPSD